MKKNRPGFFQMIRAPFLSSIISPIVAGTLLAWSITRHFEFLNFIIVLIMGVCLHIATNVYNDIYDTLQGTDTINLNRNEFSGGSGVIVEDPGLLPVMVRIARLGLVGALVTTILLFFRIEASLRVHLVLLFLFSAFFSKYYTAAPVKLAYRGWGEISVWFAFGPMAILVAAVSQNVGLQAKIWAAMPITGISTLSILLIGQMIDLDADKAAGKWGIAVRLGLGTTGAVYAAIQLFLCLNIILLATLFPDRGLPVLFCLVPYILLLPKILNILFKNPGHTELLKKAARLNVLLHLSFSALFIVLLVISIVIWG